MRTVRKFLATMLLLLFVVGSAFTQNISGKINGTIVTSDGTAAEAVSVQIKQSNKGAVTDAKGYFEFRKLKAGSYVLTVSITGYQPMEETVVVEADKTATVSFKLTASQKELIEVVITAGSNKFGKKESDYVARLPLKNVENPQVYNVVGKELLQEQVVTSFDDAVKNAPGVNKLWTSTGRGGDGAGYFSMRGFSVQPTMINGVAGLTNGGIDPANVERIESIKGPSGTLFGSSLISFGGLLNIVTKRPYDSTGGEVSYTGGSYGLSRVTADVNTSLNKDKTALIRLNGAYHYEGSFQDAGFKKTVFLAPSFSYQASEKLSFLINTEFYTSEGTNPLMVFLNRTRALIAKTPEELNFNFKRSYTSNDVTVKNPTMNLYGQVNYKLSPHWVSQTNLSRSVRQTNGYYSYVMYVGASDTLLTRYLTKQAATGTSTGIQQNFIGDFKIGNMRNRIVTGLDFLNIQTHNNNTPYIVFDQVNSANKKDSRYAMLTKEAIDAKLAVATGNAKNGTKGSTYSAYFSDVLNITPSLLAMVSLRVDHFDNKGNFNYISDTVTGSYSQTSLSPKFGVVYQLVKDKVAVFGNYMNGFRNVAPVAQPLADIDGTFKPQNANQWEGGVKLDVLQHKLCLTASYYDLLVSNMTRTESVERNGQTYNITVQDGSQKSKGFELDAAASPIPGLNIVAGFSHNNSKMVKADKSVADRRPTSAGPENMANLWMSYTAFRGKLKGFGVGFGGNYASENMITNQLVTGTFTLPAYTVINGTVFYNARIYRLALKLDNIANKEYFGGWSTVERQMPRRVMASVAFRF